MGLDDALGDGETEAGSSPVFRSPLPEAVVDVRDLLGGNAPAFVLDPEAHNPVADVRPQADDGARRRELDRVAEEVREDLPDPIAVGQDERRWRGELGPQLE